MVDEQQLQLIHNISLVTAVVSCLRFYKILKTELYGHKPLSKLFAFKLMVGINFLMGVSFLSCPHNLPRPLSFPPPERRKLTSPTAG